MTRQPCLVPRAFMRATAETPRGDKPAAIDIEKIRKSGDLSLDYVAPDRSVTVVGQPNIDETG